MGGAENVGGIAELIINSEKRFRRERQGVSLSVKIKINMFHVSSQSAFVHELRKFCFHGGNYFRRGCLDAFLHEMGCIVPG